MPCQSDPYEEKIAEELELQLRRFGVTDLEPFNDLLVHIDQMHKAHGLGVAFAAGVWYYVALIRTKQHGREAQALDIDRAVEHLARLMTKDKVL